jgi:hypothetical protein
MPQLRVNDVDLAYSEQGAGTPVVFVHGVWMDLRYWEPQRQAIAPSGNARPGTRSWDYQSRTMVSATRWSRSPPCHGLPSQTAWRITRPSAAPRCGISMG